LPQAPQLALSVVVLVQLEPHCVSPVPHDVPQTPPEQTPAHVLPQPPQLVSLPCVSTQV
jgi:hypothetical protein